MSTIKFKNPETGLWEKVGIPTSGGGVSTVHIGSEPPTDANANMWYDTDDQQGSFYTAEQVDELLSGKVSMELIWENASYNSEFAAQTVNFSKNLNEGDMIAILSMNGVSEKFLDNIRGYFFGRVGSGSYMTKMSAYTYNNKNAHMFEQRSFIVTPTGVTFKDNIRWDTIHTAEETMNSSMIPAHIYLIKGVSA